MKSFTSRWGALVLMSALVVPGLAQEKAGQRVFDLQFKRFEGSYQIDKGGTLDLKATADGCTWMWSGGPVNVSASSAFDEATNRQKAKAKVGKDDADGTVLISGKDVVLSLKLKGTEYRLRLRLNGRNDGELDWYTVTPSQPESVQFSGTAKRS